MSIIVKNLIAVLLISLATAVNAAVITFDDLSGSNGGSFTSYTESGFDVAATSDNWAHGFLVGKPAPSLFNFTGNSESLSITRSSNGLFTFDSIDFGTGGSGSYRH